MAMENCMDIRFCSDSLADSTTNMDPFDRIKNWNLDIDLVQDATTAPKEEPDDVVDNYHFGDLEEADLATFEREISVFRDFITQLPAYEWLLQSIRKELYMDNRGKVQTDIRRKILDYLPTDRKISRKKGPQRFIMTFNVDWDPHSFFREQEYRESFDKAVERAITITGSEIDAQAATTTQYISQTWPLFGIHLLRVVKRVVCATDNIPFACMW